MKKVAAARGLAASAVEDGMKLNQYQRLVALVSTTVAVIKSSAT